MNHYEKNIPFNLHQYTAAQENEELDSNEEDKNDSILGKKQNNISIENEITSNRSISLNKDNDKSKYFFGESASDQSQRVKATSPFKNIKSWKIAHLMIKTGDNLMQEQFALQLIHQFYQIFELEKTNLKVTPYEVLSLGEYFFKFLPEIY